MITNNKDGTYSVLSPAGDELRKFKKRELAEIYASDSAKEEMRAEYVKTAHKRKNINTRKIRVRCIDTGEEYPSMNQAARTTYVSERSIHKSIRTGQPISGLRWERI